ncbi:MAG TPA: hypothetical protein VII47_04510 [Actinomycetota bacterium]
MGRGRLGALGWAALLVVLVGAAGCGSGSGATPAPATSRPKSTGTISIVEPKAGQTVTGGTLHVKVAVEGATILNNPNVVKPTPSQGHVHLSIDGKVVSMVYGPEQDVAVTPGRHLLEAEFVAGDHLPFNPRVAQKTTFVAE